MPTEENMTTTLASPNIDDRLRNVITHHPHLKIDQVHFSTQQGHVTLKGHVKSFFQKQMAQEAIRGIEGVETVDNELVVEWA